MRIISTCLFFSLLAFSGWAQTLGEIPEESRLIEETANRLFHDLPAITTVEDMRSHCGAGEEVNALVAYCTTRNKIYHQTNGSDGPAIVYMLAHVYGHAVQVKHGLADVALREIRSRPAEEEKLRGWVTRQVECIAGFIVSNAELDGVRLGAVFDSEPMTGSHWGRDPLAVGPRVSIGTAARQRWFDKGYEGDLSKCNVGEFGSELLLDALK